MVCVQCQDKFAELTRQLYSTQRLNDPKVIQQLQSDRLYQALRGVAPQPALGTSKEEEKEAVENFFAEV